MGCNCGRKNTRRLPSGTAVNRQAAATAQSAAQKAQVFQSATLRKAPTGPVTTRRTV